MNNAQICASAQLSTLHIQLDLYMLHVDALCSVSVIKDCFVPNSNFMSFGPFVMYKYLKFVESYCHL